MLVSQECMVGVKPPVKIQSLKMLCLVKGKYQTSTGQVVLLSQMRVKDRLIVICESRKKRTLFRKNYIYMEKWVAVH